MCGRSDGAFFYEQTPESLADSLRRFDDRAFDPVAIRAHAQQFDAQVFESRLQAFIREQMGDSWS